MPKTIWHFALDGTSHTVEIDHSTLTGKSTIAADGVPVVRQTKALSFSGEHTFDLGGHCCTVSIRPNWANWLFLIRPGQQGLMTYSCLIDGQPVVSPQQPAQAEQQRSLQMINRGIIAGFLCAAFLFLPVALTIWAGSEILGIGLSSLIDVVIVLALTYGLQRRMRSAAVLLLVYFVLNESMWWTTLSTSSGAIAARAVYGVALCFLLYQGIRGTFAHHRLAKRAAAPTTE